MTSKAEAAALDADISTAETTLDRLKAILDATPAEHPERGRRRSAWRAQADTLARLRAERKGMK